MRSAYKVKVMSVEEFRDNVSSKCEADSAVVLPPALLIRFYNQLLSVREGFSKKMRKSLVICQTGGGGYFSEIPHLYIFVRVWPEKVAKEAGVWNIGGSHDSPERIWS